MEKIKRQSITVHTTVKAPIDKVWKFWTLPEHITHWNYASDTWHTPFVNNDLKVGGKFLFRMEAKDRSEGFDFEGVYETVKINELIEYKLSDTRKVRIDFTTKDNETTIVETFEAEDENSIEVQKGGWQSILDNFKKYTEAN